MATSFTFRFSQLSTRLLRQVGESIEWIYGQKHDCSHRSPKKCPLRDHCQQKKDEKEETKKKRIRRRRSRRRRRTGEKRKRRSRRIRKRLPCLPLPWIVQIIALRVSSDMALDTRAAGCRHCPGWKPGPPLCWLLSVCFEG